MNLRLLTLASGLLAAALPSHSQVTPAPATPAAVAPETVIEAKSLDMRSTDTETVAIFKGNVIVVGNNVRISCDHLEVVASRVGARDDTVPRLDQFKSLVATGRVRIIQGDREVTCGRAEVFPKEERIILTESPVVVDHSGPYVATGSRLVLLRGERRIFGDDVKFTGPPIIDLGFDRNQPMKTPAAEPSPKP